MTNAAILGVMKACAVDRRAWGDMPMFMAEQESSTMFYAIGGFLAFTALVVWAAWYSMVQRRKRLSAWAQSKGLRFRPANDTSIERRYGEFDCLRQGHSRHAYNVMTGDWGGRNLTAFDYSYTTGSGKNRHTYTFSAVILDSPVPLKPLFIRPEHFFDKIAGVFGFEDINFESAEFSRKFHVAAPEKKWAYDVITQATMDFLLAQPHFNVKFDPRGVIAYRATTFRVADFEAAAVLLAGLFDRLPEYVIQQQRGQP